MTENGSIQNEVHVKEAEFSQLLFAHKQLLKICATITNPGSCAFCDLTFHKAYVTTRGVYGKGD